MPSIEAICEPIFSAKTPTLPRLSEFYTKDCKFIRREINQRGLTPFIFPFIFWYTTADCMKINCGGKSRCIGTDKIGHFFQQGFMGWELRREQYSLDFIEKFFEFTEGLAEHNYEGKFSFYGFEELPAFQDFKGKWGPLQQSWADVASNMAGTKFYANIPNLCECLYKRIKDVVTGPSQIRSPGCFDICDYVDDRWSE